MLWRSPVTEDGAVYFPYYTRTVVYGVDSVIHCRGKQFHGLASACDGLACDDSNAVGALVQRCTSSIDGGLDIASTDLEASTDATGDRIDVSKDRLQNVCQTAGMLLRATDGRRGGEGRQYEHGGERGKLEVHVACVGGLQRIVGARKLGNDLLSFMR